MRGSLDKLFHERNCAHCGKNFIITASIRDYLYKIELNKARRGIAYYCKYSHYKIGLEEYDRNNVDKRRKQEVN